MHPPVLGTAQSRWHNPNELIVIEPLLLADTHSTHPLQSQLFEMRIDFN